MLLSAEFDDALDRELLNRITDRTLPQSFGPSLEDLLEVFKPQAPPGARWIVPESPDNFRVETIIRAFKRPSLLVRDGSFERPESETWGEVLDTARQALETALPAVGRIELKNHPNLAWAGTGFLVDTDVVVTNRHVAEHFVERQGEGLTWRTNSRGKVIRGRIDFREEDDRPAEEEFEVTDALYIEPGRGPDLAILRIETTGLTAQPLALATLAAQDDFVAAVGYTWKDSRVPSELTEAMERIFHGIFDVKRMAPGKLTRVDTNDLEHDCTTLGGNSGSAVIDLETGAVVGLHYGGDIDANHAVPAAVLADRLAQI